MSTLTCPDCGAPMALRRSWYGPFYGCTRYPACKGAHGAHPDGKPLGIPADQATKQARIRAHAALDPLWQEAVAIVDYGALDRRGRRAVRQRARVRAYAWLAKQLDMDLDACHIGRFDKATCNRVVELCAPMTPEDVRDWAKERGL
jgi:hypothetical protein